MKVLAVLLLLCAVAFASSHYGKVIYGSDDRKDTYEVSSSLQDLGDGAVIILFGSDDVLTENGDGTWSATSTDTAEDFWGYCSTERFSQQLILSEATGFCSGFLLSTNPPWVGTAAHCTEGSTTGAYVIFGFELTSSSNTRTTFSADDVYFVDSVVISGTPSGGAGDYGVFELDRPVTGHTPYTSFNGDLSVNDNLVMIGHPNGLPKKTDDGGEVQEVSGDLINATVDAYGGNSGSPVFDSNGNLAGILVGGAPDFATYSPCLSSNFCPGGVGCSSEGENIVPICALLESSSTISNVLGDCSGDSSFSISSGISSVSSFSPATVSYSPVTFSPATVSYSPVTFSPVSTVDSSSSNDDDDDSGLFSNSSNDDDNNDDDSSASKISGIVALAIVVAVLVI